MNLAKFFVAVFIGIFLSAFVSQAISLVYSAPEYSMNSYFEEDSNSCYKLITDACGDYSSSTNYSEYSKCTSTAYSSSDYKECTSKQSQSYEDRASSYTKKMQTYQLVNLIIYGLLGIIFVILGFLLVSKESIGTGLIIGGSYLASFGGFLSILFSLGSMFSGLLSGGEENGFQIIIQVVQLIGSGIMLAVLIVFGYFRLEKEDSH